MPQQGDWAGLTNAIKRIASDVASAKQLADLAIGTVSFSDPSGKKYKVILEDTGLEIDQANLILTTLVADGQIKVESACANPLCSSPVVGYIINALKEGDRLVMIRSANGQRYIVVGKVVD